MDYKKLYIHLREQLIKEAKGDFRYYADTYFDILLYMSEAEIKEDNYEKNWYLLRKNIMDRKNELDDIMRKEIFNRILDHVIEMEHAEKGLVSEALETEQY